MQGLRTQRRNIEHKVRDKLRDMEQNVGDIKKGYEGYEYEQ